MRKCVLFLTASLLALSSLFAQTNDLLSYLKSKPEELKVSAADLAEATISSQYTDQRLGLTYVYLQQWHEGIRVYNGVLSIALKNDRIVSAAPSFANGIAKRAPAATVPAILARTAVQRAAEHLGLPLPASIDLVSTAANGKKQTFQAPGLARRPVEVELVWAFNESGVRLTWNVNVDLAGREDWWNVRVDALNGNVVDKDNWTVHETAPGHREEGPAVPALLAAPRPATTFQTAAPQLFPPDVTSGAYRVFSHPLESPLNGNSSLETNPWLKAGAGNAAITHGWHFDGTNNYNITRGNNVFAYLDRSGSNAANATTNWPDTSTTLSPSLTFDNAGNPAINATDRFNQKLALTNLFYWNNIIHDVTYQYGLTEPAGAFQTDNMGRGGAGNDHVRAEAQDAGGTNNANFSTPTDGTSGRMQMFLWSGMVNLDISAPASIAGRYRAKENAFTSPNKLVNIGPISGQVVYYNDQSASTHLACTTPSNIIAGKIALIDWGSNSCTFLSRAQRAQAEGAIGVIVINSSNSYLNNTFLSGSDNALTIPAVVVTSVTGTAIAAQLNAGQTVTLTMTGIPNLDGDLDNGIITHEYGHGVSNRLTGGPTNSSCLGNAEQAGEGWSDYLGLMLTTNWATAQLGDGALARGIGNYALGNSLGQTGIRLYPYTTNMSINPLTYANLPSSVAPHGTGTIWCSALWDMTWNIIQQTGSITPDIYNSNGTGGNVIAFNLVMTAMKLQPCQPGFLDSRDAILAADSILYNKTYRCAIWNAFARRGMGVSAKQGSSSSNTDGTAAFDVASVILTKTTNPLQVAGGTQLALTTTASCMCDCGKPVGPLQVQDSIPAGFTYLSSTGGTFSGGKVTFPAFDFNTSTAAQNFTVNLTTPAGCPIDSLINDNRETSTVGGMTSAAITGTINWAPSNVRSFSAPSSWLAPNSNFTSDLTLTSDPFTPGPISVLSFRHYYRLETGWDGGVVEYSTNGTNWIDASPLIYETPYNSAIGSGSALSGRKAYSGNSNSFLRTQVDLSPLQGQSVRIRFRVASDNNTADEGWYVDNIAMAKGCGGVFKGTLFGSTGARLDSMAVRIFTIPAAASPLPLTLLQFTASKSGAKGLLQWETSDEVNTSRFIVEHSGDGRSWHRLGTVAARGSGNGNYQFLHALPITGRNYYRLKMIDVDERFSYAPIRLLDFRAPNSILLLPNPARDRSQVVLQEALLSPRVRVTDINGKVVAELQLNGRIRQFELNTQSWAAGTYTVSVQSAEGSMHAKLVVAH